MTSASGARSRNPIELFRSLCARDCTRNSAAAQRRLGDTQRRRTGKTTELGDPHEAFDLHEAYQQTRFMVCEPQSTLNTILGTMPVRHICERPRGLQHGRKPADNEGVGESRRPHMGHQRDKRVSGYYATNPRQSLVPVTGIELVTFALRMRCSTN